VWDIELKGFGLLVLPSGVKSYIYDYRTQVGTKRRIFIGQHGAWTAEQARDKAEDYRQIVRAGGDPLGAKQALRASATVRNVLDAYLASEDFANKTPITQAIDRGRIERHLRPLLGKKLAHLLTDEDIKRAQKDIREGKTAVDVKTGARGRARVRGGEGAARMAIVVLGVILNWAIRARMMKENPCRFVKVGPGGTRDAILEDAEDYGRMFKTLDRMERELRIRPPVADAIRLIALTGCRRGEAAGLRWSQVDLKRGRLVLPPNAHKTGRKTGKPRIIGLPTAAQAIISRQPVGGDNDYVFSPAKGNGGVIDLTHAWEKVRAEAKLPNNLGLHGLRHSLASHMAMGGAQASEIMTQLGHRQLSTAQKYVHWAQDARQLLAERAATVALKGMAAQAESEGSGAERRQVMKPLPTKIREALSFTLHEWELSAAERLNADEFVTFLENCKGPEHTLTADDPHIDTLARGVRDLLAAGHVAGAVYVAIKLGEVWTEDEIENSIRREWLERGKSEAAAIEKAALRRWGSPEQRRKIDEEILAVAIKGGVAASNGKQALHEVAHIMNERHPGLRITARKVRRVLTGN
jgi:integrase